MAESLLKIEAGQITQISDLVGKRLDEAETPVGISLLSLNLGPVTPKEVLVTDKNSGMLLQTWEFAPPPSTEALSAQLSIHAKENIATIAKGLEVEEELVLRAAALTRTLVEYPSSPTAVILEDGPEVLKMARSALPDTNDNGIYRPGGSGYMLEYYTVLGLVPDIGGVIPLLHSLAKVPVPTASFQDLFPAVLTFSTHVARRHESLGLNGAGALTSANTDVPS